MLQWKNKASIFGIAIFFYFTIKHVLSKWDEKELFILNNALKYTFTSDIATCEIIFTYV